jgi:hypothetical protein
MGQQGYYFEWKEGRVMKKWMCIGSSTDGSTLESYIEAETQVEAMDVFIARYKDIVQGVDKVTEVESEELAVDEVNHPAHYRQGNIECIDALAAATINLKGIKAVCTANAIKYLWRWQKKNGKQDLQKAKWYIDRLIEELNDD